MLNFFYLDEYKEVKSHLQNAVQRKNPEAIEKALDELDRKVPNAKIPEDDKNFIKQAKELQDKLENIKRV